jgi:GNAT superfamily N-acetyltransferase
LHNEIKKISHAELKKLVTEFHYLGGKAFRASFCYGLFIDGKLSGGIVYHGISAPETAVGAFGLSRTEQSGLWEIGRLVLIPEINGKNFGSFLISRSLKMLIKETTVRAIITYAEAPRHNGGIYRASNFIYCGLTTPKKDFYINGVKKERGITKGVIGGEWRPRPQKHRFVRIFDPTLNLKWNIETKKENF